MQSQELSNLYLPSTRNLSLPLFSMAASSRPLVTLLGTIWPWAIMSATICSGAWRSTVQDDSEMGARTAATAMRIYGARGSCPPFPVEGR